MGTEGDPAADAVAIRRGEASDASALAELGERTFVATYGRDTVARDLALFLAATYGAERQRAELEEPSITTLVAEYQGTLAGFVQVRAAPAPACVATAGSLELGRFYVDAPWHGRGVAQRLMAAAIRCARTRGASGLWLGVFERNARARRFYERSGFAVAGESYFDVGLDRQRDLILWRADA